MREGIIALILILVLTFTSCNSEEVRTDITNTPQVQQSQTQINEATNNIVEFDLQVIFNSKELISQIENYLSKNKEITQEEIESIKEITLQYYSDKPIIGIEYLKNVEKLILEGSKIEDFSILNELENLVKFEIHRMEIEDLSPLLNSKRLRELNIYANSIESTLALKEMVNLEILEIDLKNVEVATILQIPNLKKLIMHIDEEDKNEKLIELNKLENVDIILDMSNYNTSDSSLSVISGLKNVKGVVLDDAYVSDCSILTEFDKLELLSADYSRLGNDNEFTNVISKIPSLIYLYIDYSSAYSVDFVKDLPNLKELDISQMEECMDFSALSQAVNLEKLVINGSLYGVENISFLKEMSMLVSLDMALNEINDIDDLSGLSNLTYLNLVYNNIEDITALSNLTKLRELHLFGNNISDISALYSLENLIELVLFDNQITDISAISNLTQLEKLHLRNNQIEDISVLRNLTNLTYLNIEGNPIGNIEILEELGFESKGDGVYYRYLNNPD